MAESASSARPGKGLPALNASSAESYRTARFARDHEQTDWLSEFDRLNREIQHRYWKTVAGIERAKTSFADADEKEVDK